MLSFGIKGAESESSNQNTQDVPESITLTPAEVSAGMKEGVVTSYTRVENKKAVETLYFKTVTLSDGTQQIPIVIDSSAS